MPQTNLPPKVYTKTDIPRPSDMADYLGRVRAIWETISAIPGVPEVPPDMERLSYGRANDIELILLYADRSINSMINSWIYSGEFESGGI